MPKQCGIFFLAQFLRGGIFNGAKKRRHSVSIWLSFNAPYGSNGLIVMWWCGVMGSAWLALWLTLVRRWCGVMDGASKQDMGSTWLALLVAQVWRWCGAGTALWVAQASGLNRGNLSGGASRAQPLPKIAGSGAWLSYAKHRSFAIVHKRVKPRHINVCIKSCINAFLRKFVKCFYINV